MKQFKNILSVFVVIALLAVTVSASAARVPGSARDQINRDVAGNFSVLAHQVYCALSSSQVVTPTDITSTNTYTIAYCPTTITPPVRVHIQYLGTAKIYETIYGTNASNVVAPTATCAYLLDKRNTTATPVIGDTIDEIFYDRPNISFSGGGSAATFTIEVYTLPSYPWQE
ncbi:MAG: hypothetical protein HQM09_15230 [Candidatus Riflebacteria bacterium]|nr:hypothetical protein [Candidatus Riflebacteria bacterium]